ncbi:MAG: hypothetical protein H7Y28_15960 [Rhodoferax sp.]|nr:hypothetical protein [Rhodoferax sp.]
MAKNALTVREQASDAILDLVLHVPSSKEQALLQPAARAHAIGRNAARQATLLASSLALPPGVLGWLTVLPELIGVWRIQAQMVSDIAAVYGKQKSIKREEMLYCLFKHVSAQLFRDVAVRVGQRVVVREASTRVLQSIAQALGIKVTQKVLSKGAARFVPLLGAVGVGAYAYFDTLQVAKTANELFAQESTTKVPPAPAE